MKRSSATIIPFILLFTFLCSFVQITNASTAKKTFKKSISFSQGGYLSLSNKNGEIEITAWEKDVVEIIAYKVVRASDRETAEKLLEHLKIEIKENGNEIVVETDFPNSSDEGFFGWLFEGSSNSFSVSYEVKVPRKIDLNIHTTNGDVEVEDVSGRLRLESTNGSIVGRDIQGLTKCRTTNGSIKVSFDEVSDEDEMNFKTTNGSIKLYLPDSYGAQAELKTTNGHIDSDFSMSGSSYKSKKKFSGMINDGGHDLYCKTTNGNISLIKN